MWKRFNKYRLFNATKHFFVGAHYCTLQGLIAQ